MKKIILGSFFILNFALCFNASAKTIVSRPSDTMEIMIDGDEAQQMVEFLRDKQRYAGSFVIEEASMGGKVYLMAPGLKCTILTYDGDTSYRCVLNFNDRGAIELTP